MKLIHLLLPATLIAGAVTLKQEKNLVYATTDMTYAEFYAGEIGSSSQKLSDEGYDGVSTATKRMAKRFTQCHIAEDASQIFGLAKVGVAMNAKTYKKLTPEQKARFTLVTDSVFPAYKMMDVNGNFGPYTAQVVKIDTVTSTLSSGGSSTWGNYTLRMNGLQLKEKVLGAVLTTSDGAQYGLKHQENIWMNPSSLAFNVEDFEEPHGLHPSFKHTQSIMGKTITNVRYILQGGNQLSIDVNEYVKPLTEAKVEIADTKAGEKIRTKVNGLPDGYKLIEVRYRKDRRYTRLTPEQFSLVNGEILLQGDTFPATTYTAIFQSDSFSDISATFSVEE